MSKNKLYPNLVISSNKEIIADPQQKKELDKSLVLSDNGDMKQIFNPTVKSYTYYFNPELKKYEMFTIFIDPLTGEMKLERKLLDIDSEPRAIMEMQRNYSTDYIERLKRR